MVMEEAVELLLLEEELVVVVTQLEWVGLEVVVVIQPSREALLSYFKEEEVVVVGVVVTQALNLVEPVEPVEEIMELRGHLVMPLPLVEEAERK